MGDPGAHPCEREGNGARVGRGRHGAKQAGHSLGGRPQGSPGAPVVLRCCLQLAAMARPLWALRFISLKRGFLLLQGSMWPGGGDSLQLRPSLKGLTAEGPKLTTFPGMKSFFEGGSGQHDRAHHTAFLDRPVTALLLSMQQSDYLPIVSPTGQWSP